MSTSTAATAVSPDIEYAARLAAASCDAWGGYDDPEALAVHGGLAEIVAERDQYAAEAQGLLRALADAHAREIFLNNTINELRTGRPVEAAGVFSLGAVLAANGAAS